MDKQETKEVKPFSWAVMAFDRVQKLVVREDVAEECAQGLRQIDPNAYAKPLYDEPTLDAAVSAEREGIKDALLAMHERDKGQHNYWAFAARELFGA